LKLKASVGKQGECACALNSSGRVKDVSLVMQLSIAVMILTLQRFIRRYQGTCLFPDTFKFIHEANQQQTAHPSLGLH